MRARRWELFVRLSYPVQTLVGELDVVVVKSCLGSYCVRDRPIVLPARENGPRDTGKLVGCGCDHYLDRSPALKSVEPGTERRSFSLDAEDGGSSTMHKQLPQIAVAALANAEEPCLATGRVLSWDKSQPGGELPGLVKGRSVADCGDDRGRNQGTYAKDLPESLAGWIGRSDLFHLFVHRDVLLLQVFPLAPQQADEVTHAWCEVEMNARMPDADMRFIDVHPIEV